MSSIICAAQHCAILEIYLKSAPSYFRRVFQAVGTVINWFIDAIIYWEHHIQFLLVTASTALVPIIFIALSAGAKALGEQLEDQHI